LICSSFTGLPNKLHISAKHLHSTAAVVGYSPEAKNSFGQIMEILYEPKNGVYTFGYNSAKSELI